MTAAKDRRTTPERRIEEDRRPSPIWFRLDAAFLADDKIIDLGEEHTGLGPMIYVALLGAAKIQDDDGSLHMGWRQLARGAFLPGGHEQARLIVRTCVDLGLLTEFVDDGRSFTCMIVGWGRRQRPADPTAAARQKRYRDRQKHAESDGCVTDTDRNGDRNATVTAESVTSHHGTTETETETETETSCSTESAAVAHDAAGENLQTVIDDVERILDRCPRVGHVDRFGIEQHILARPTLDHRSAARRAAARINDPKHKVTDAARVLGWELDNLARDLTPSGPSGRAGPSSPPHGRHGRDPHSGWDAETVERIYARSAAAVEGVEPWEDE